MFKSESGFDPVKIKMLENGPHTHQGRKINLYVLINLYPIGEAPHEELRCMILNKLYKATQNQLTRGERLHELLEPHSLSCNTLFLYELLIPSHSGRTNS